MDIIRQAIVKAKKLFKHRATQATILAIIGLIYLKRAGSPAIPKVKLSYFMMALAQGVVAEVVVNGSSTKFKSLDSQNWYETNTSLLTRNTLFTLLS